MRYCHPILQERPLPVIKKAAKPSIDKRKVFDNSELIAMLADNAQMYPDTLPVRGTSIKDLNMEVVKEYLAKRFAPVFSLQNISAD